MSMAEVGSPMQLSTGSNGIESCGSGQVHGTESMPRSVSLGLLYTGGRGCWGSSWILMTKA